MKNDYINKTFLDRYKQFSRKGNNINTTIKDLDIYRQILKNWENEIDKELGIRIIYDFNQNKFKVNFPEKEKEIHKYFSKRKEILKFIFSPIIIRKIKENSDNLKDIDIPTLKEFLWYIVYISDKRSITDENKKMIKNIYFENSINIYKNIFEKIKEIKILILPIDFDNFSFEELTNISISGPYFYSFKDIKGTKEGENLRDFLTKKADEIINYEKELFKEFNNDFSIKENTTNKELLKKLKDVPKDGNCLFWAIIFSYLEPVKKNNYDFKNRHINLFGNDTKFNFILEKKELSFENYINNKKLLLLFRNKIVNYIKENLDTNRGENKSTFRSAILDSEILKEIRKKNPNINEEEQIIKTLEIMKKDGTWGGSIEVEAICNILKCQIIRNNETFVPDIINPDSIKIKLHFENNHYQYFLIKNNKKININTSISFSIDKILKEESSNKKIKVEDKSMDFNEEFQFPKIQNNINPKFWVKDTSVNYLYSELKHQDIISINQNERPTSNCSAFTSSTINSNYSTGTFLWTSDEERSISASTISIL